MFKLIFSYDFKSSLYNVNSAWLPTFHKGFQALAVVYLTYIKLRHNQTIETASQYRAQSSFSEVVSSQAGVSYVQPRVSYLAATVAKAVSSKSGPIPLVQSTV